MKRARVIYNPTSGKELIRKNLADILDVLETGGYEASALPRPLRHFPLVMKQEEPAKLVLIWW